jgi:ubiquinone/menaquinone biosynthesis C-methylase UbiE
MTRFYNRIGSRGWRNSDYFTFSVRSPAYRRWLASRLGPRPLQVLSAGCGTGELEKHLSDLRHRVFGLDPYQQMLQRARENGVALLVQADSLHLPFRDASFDVVMFVESVGYLRLPTAFEEARRVLKTGGRLLVTTYSGDVEVHASYAKLGLDDLMPALTAAGLQVEEHRFLNAKRSSVSDVAADDESNVLFVSARKPRQA